MQNSTNSILNALGTSDEPNSENTHTEVPDTISSTDSKSHIDETVLQLCLGKNPWNPIPR